MPQNSSSKLLVHEVPKDVVFTKPTSGFGEVNVEKFHQDQSNKKVLLQDLAGQIDEKKRRKLLEKQLALDEERLID